MKKAISILLAFVLAVGLMVPVSAAAKTENVDITYRAIKIELNGEEITPCDEAGNTVEPFIMNSSGTTYMPLRAIAQALGLDVKWEAATSSVILNTGGTVKIGEDAPGTTVTVKNVNITYRDIKIILDGEELELKNSLGVTVEPFILNGTTYLPLRIVGEALGLTVAWDGANNTAGLTETNSEPKPDVSDPTPKPDIKTYTVTFVDYDGTVLKTQVVKEGQDATPPDDPIREGYTFVNWDRSFHDVASDLEVVAIYSLVEFNPAKLYTVTFYDYDGSILKTDTVGEGQAATPPAPPTREGYEFFGWDTSYNCITYHADITAVYLAIESEKQTPPTSELPYETGLTNAEVVQAMYSDKDGFWKSKDGLRVFRYGIQWSGIEYCDDSHGKLHLGFQSYFYASCGQTIDYNKETKTISFELYERVCDEYGDNIGLDIYGKPLTKELIANNYINEDGVCVKRGGYNYPSRLLIKDFLIAMLGEYYGLQAYENMKELLLEQDRYDLLLRTPSRIDWLNGRYVVMALHNYIMSGNTQSSFEVIIYEKGQTDNIMDYDPDYDGRRTHVEYESFFGDDFYTANELDKW